MDTLFVSLLVDQTIRELHARAARQRQIRDARDTHPERTTATARRPARAKAELPCTEGFCPPQLALAD